LKGHPFPLINFIYRPPGMFPHQRFFIMQCLLQDRQGVPIAGIA